MEQRGLLFAGALTLPSEPGCTKSGGTAFRVPGGRCLSKPACLNGSACSQLVLQVREQPEEPHGIPLHVTRSPSHKVSLGTHWN